MKLHTVSLFRAAAPVLLCALSFSGISRGAIIFSDDYDSVGPVTITAQGTTVSGSYTVNHTTTTNSNNRTIIGYDYSDATLGIPSAPRSSGGTQKGVRFDANTGPTGVISSIAMSPNVTLSGDYQIRFDMWLNTIGPMPGGGTGSTEHMTVGVGYNGSTFQNASSASGVWFAVDGEGGSSGTSTTPDFMARINAVFQGPATAGVYAAGTATGNPGSSVDNANAYYTALFPGQAPPAAQTTNYPASQTGTSANGAVGFKWRDVVVNRIGNTVTWYIDNNLIATVTDAAATANNRAFVGFWDAFASLDTGGLVFGVIDNLEISEIPEPATASLIALCFAGVGLAARRGRA